MKQSSWRVSAFVDRVHQCTKRATAAVESCQDSAKSGSTAGISRLRTVQGKASTQVSKSRAISMVLSIAAMLATTSVCSAQSIEIAELTDEALQIDGTVMYVYGTDFGAPNGAKAVVDRVTIEEYPLDQDLIMVRVWNAANEVVASKVSEWASLEAVIVSLGPGGDSYDNDTFVRDIVNGGPGNDDLNGGDGISWLYGEGGEDHLDDGSGNDVVDGGDDRDFIYGGDGDDILIGGAGNDDLHDDSGVNWLFGGTGEDELKSTFGEGLAFGEDDNDEIYISDSSHAYGGMGDDTIHARVAYGGAGNDEITGTDQVDFLVGEAGNDTIRGRFGNDFLNGGSGVDTLYGQDTSMPGDYVLDDNDVIHGGPDRDHMYGGIGNDTMNGDDGDDVIYGGLGNDTLRGGNNNDTLYGDFGVDTLFGDAGNDSLFGGSGTFDLSIDTLWGNSGADRFNRAYKPGVNPPVLEDIRADFNAGQGDTNN